MIKIVNGKIVREGVVGNSSASSPVLPSTRRRCSIQDLQLKEYEQQVLQSTPPPAPQEPDPNFVPSWMDIFKQEILVFGLHVNLITLCVLSIVSLFIGGFTALLVALVGIYLGTLFKPKAVQKSNDIANSFGGGGGGNVLGKSSSPLGHGM